jgi:hypothetical protein
MLKGWGATAGLMAVLLATSSSAQAPHGYAIPPLASAGFGWQTGIADWQDPPPSNMHGPIKPHPDHPYVSNAEAGRTGKQPTLRIGNDTDPILKPWAAKIMRDSNEEALKGDRAIPFAAQARCFPGGVPGQLLFPFEPMYFIQLPNVIYIMWQRDQHVRRIRLTDKHSEDVKPSWFGESIGRYEDGDTLVVDTIGLSTKNSYIDNFRTPHTEKLHVVERFTISPDRNMLTAVVTVTDPDTFNAPLTMQQRWTKVNEPMKESICAENNFDFFSQNLFPVPTAETPEF